MTKALGCPGWRGSQDSLDPYPAAISHFTVLQMRAFVCPQPCFNDPHMPGTLFVLPSPPLPPFLLPKASASSSRLLYPSMHVTFSKKPPLASPRKEFLPQPLHSAEIKGAGSAARQPGVTPRLLHTPRHDSGASALPCTTAQRQFHKVLGRMK